MSRVGSELRDRHPDVPDLLHRGYLYLDRLSGYPSPTIWTLCPFVNYDEEMTSTTTSPMRADARRNYDALRAAGKDRYATGQANVPFEEVPKKAGGRQGTLDRRVPRRDELW